MPHAGVYVLASLISGVSTALILASGPSYTEPRSPQGTVYDVKQGQSAYDGCRSRPCQIAYLHSVDDFCLWAPSQLALSATRDMEHTLVAWCMKSTHGPHAIPDGTISGAHLVITPEYVQITGVGKLTNINVPADGVASASGQDHHAHGVVFTSAYGQLEQVHDWTSFVSQERFCFRACKPSAAASIACQEIREFSGCLESVPGNHDPGVFEDCLGDTMEVPSTLYQDILAAPLHHSARPFTSSCTRRGKITNAQVTRARRAIAPILVDSLSQSQSTSMTSSMTPPTTETATTITFPSFPTSASTTTSFMNSSTPGSPSNAPTTVLCPYNHTYSYNHTHSYFCSHWTSRTDSLSYNHPPTSSASFSHRTFSHTTASSTVSSLNDPLTSSSSLPISPATSFILTFPTSSPSDPSSGTLTSFTPTTPTSTPTAAPSFPSSAYGASSSPSGFSFSPSPSYGSSIASSVTTPTSPSTPPFSLSSTSSQTPYALTFTTTSSSSDPSTSPTTSSPPVSPSTSTSTSSSSPSQSSYVLSFTTPSSSAPTQSSPSSSSTVPNSQTQVGSQCPPLRFSVNAGSLVASLTPLLPLMLTISMIVLSSSVGIFIL